MNLSWVLAVAVLTGLLIWTGCVLSRLRSALCQELEENRCLRELVRAGAREAGAELEQMCRLPAVPNFIAYKLRAEHSFGVSPPCCSQNLCRSYFQDCHRFFCPLFSIILSYLRLASLSGSLFPAIRFM